jgi:hypothetical protein
MRSVEASERTQLKMKPLVAQPAVATPLLRAAMTRLLSSYPRGFTPEQRKALSDYKGPIQSGNPSDQLVEEARLS